jgi:1-acyl-sn-glycerol-3-phosphate acyltransferase
MNARVQVGELRVGVGARLGAWLLRLAGWRVVYVPPPGPKSVIVVYPHTSNWDFPIGFLARAVAGVRCHFVAKDTLFRGPFGRWLARVGGIPVNRREHTGLIGQLAEEFARRDEFHLVFTPEGTRSRTEYWKSGFYRLALAVRVPVGLSFIDYGAREVGIGAWIDLSGDAAADMERVRAFYAGKRGRRPELAGPVRLAEEQGGR